MKIIYGENIIQSRQALTSQTSVFRGEIIRLDGNKLVLTDLKQALESSTFFGDDRLVVIENFFSRRPSKEKDKIADYFKNENPANLIIWEGGDIDGRKLRAFSKAQARRYAITSYVFQFLDSLAPKNTSRSLHLLQACFKNENPEMILYLMARHVRLLIIANDLGVAGLDRMPSWQSGKIIKQAKQFSLQKLLDVHRDLLRIEWQQKTGVAVIPLAGRLDLLVASI